MQWLGYPFYRILFFLVLGIVVSHLFAPAIEVLYYGVILSFVVAIPFLWIYKFSTLSKSCFTLAAYSFFFFIGALQLQWSSQLAANHFMNKQEQGQHYSISLQLDQQLTSNSFNDRFYAKVTGIANEAVSGNTLILFKKTDSLNYKVGDQLVIYDAFQTPAFSRNPGDFDYRNYLASIDVYGMLYIDRSKILHHANTLHKSSFLVFFRNTLLEKLSASGLKVQVKGMIEALVLGQRQHVDPEITKSFRDAGVIHILALSGLHVGIILLILRFITRPILRIRQGRWLQSVILVVLLWFFALLTGMSPSIMRAVTMFSFIAVGMNLKRKGSVYHSLTLSAFVLLIYDPRLLFQVGFQLSYMAVFSIVLIQPMLAGLWPWRNKIKDFFWSIFTVTVAAQIGVAGISLFYFHQFPGLFILGNMLLLPVLPFIIGAALLLIVLLLIGFPTEWLTNGLNIVLEFIIDIVGKISSWDWFIIKDVYFSLGETILLYVFLFSLVLFFRPYLRRSRRERFYLKKPNWMFHVALTSVVLFIAVLIFEKYQSRGDQFLVLHQSAGSAVSLSSGNHAVLLTDFHVMDSTRAVYSLQRLQAVDNLRSKKLSLQPLENIVSFKDLPLIVIKENGLYDNSIKNAVVLLSHSPKINLERLILENQPKYIIADGSNYRNVVSNWETTCDKMGVVLKDTNKEGAVVIE